MKLLARLTLVLGGLIVGLLALWSALAIPGLWLIVPFDQIYPAEQAFAIRLVFTGLFVAACLIFVAVGREAMKEAVEKLPDAQVGRTTANRNSAIPSTPEIGLAPAPATTR